MKGCVPPSIRRSVSPLVCPSVTAFFRRAETEMASDLCRGSGFVLLRHINVTKRANSKDSDDDADCADGVLFKSTITHLVKIVVTSCRISQRELDSSPQFTSVLAPGNLALRVYQRLNGKGRWSCRRSWEGLWCKQRGSTISVIEFLRSPDVFMALFT